MDFLKAYDEWLKSEKLTDSERDELLAMDDEEKKAAFYGNLEFGTAGLRGVMGVGTARMNIHVIRHATQGFADVILRSGTADMGIAICYDCRIGSREFAVAAAEVMAANGIKSRVFESMRPTPELSFAVRHYGCAAGINVTASHNPKEYNGYKVYWSDGAQLPPDKAGEIAARMAELDVFSGPKVMPVSEAEAKGLVTWLGEETDSAFLHEVLAQSSGRDFSAVGDSFKVVYTPFHGTGYRLIPYVLNRIGVKKLYCVEEQMVPDGSFPTVKSPNPEDPQGFKLAIELADRVGADFIIGSDPDADRVGIMIRDKSGSFVPVSGNLTGVLLLDYIIKTSRESGAMPENPVALKTIVTTELARRVAEDGGVRCIDTFTGFKFMAEKKNQLEEAGEGKVIFSYEESYGYMVGDYVRDKDAVTASMLLTEMAMWYAEKGMTLFDAAQDIFSKFGYYLEKTVNLYMQGLDGLQNMKKLMCSLRENPPEEIAGTHVQEVRDYLTGISRTKKEEKKLELSGSNVLKYILDDGTAVVVRPSGTEPKIKIYILTRGEDKGDCLEKIDRFEKWAEQFAE